MSTQELRNTIVSYALEAFKSRGVRGVTMDDVSHGLQMSKRTLYQIFETKEDLLMACVQLFHKNSHERASSMLNGGLNVLEVILKECQMRLEDTHGFTREFALELKRYPRVWQYINSESERNLQKMAQFLERGIAEGVFLPGIDYHLVFAMMQRQMEYSIVGDGFASLSDEQCFFYCVLVPLRGCTTEKGRALIDEFLAHNRR